MQSVPEIKAVDRSPLTITLFARVDTANGKQRTTGWDAFVRNILNPREYASKADMPLFSAATFAGNRRSSSNVEAINAIVVEHDAGERARNPRPMQPSEAIERLRERGISAVVYSTPSATHESPRWRAVIRLMQPATRDEHGALVALVNAILDGVLAPAESSDPARAWYYGKVRGTEYHAEEVEGHPIDVASLFDEGLPEPMPLAANRPSATREDDSLLEFVDHAQALERVDRKTVAEIRSALAYVDPDDRDTWIRVGHWLYLLGETGFDLWREWSARSPKFEDGKDDPDARWETFSGSQTDYRALFKEAQRNGWKNPRKGTASKPAARFEVIPAERFAQREAPADIVKGVLPQASLAIVFGESGSGKTFFVLDLILAVAQGQRWRGLRVRGGSVVYIGAEAIAGVCNRLVAYCRHGEIEPGALALGIIADAPNFLTDDHEAIAEAIERFGGASIIVVDTLAATTPGGNENSAEDMGAVLGRLKQLHEATGALVLLVHHSGKDASKGARGWSGLRAAADVEIEVTRLGESREACVTKMKDGDDNARFAFRLVPIAIGVDDDGDAITSCIVEPVECSATPAPRPRKAGKWETAILNAARAVTPGADGFLPIEAVLAAAIERTPRDPQGRDRRREYLTRALESLAIEREIFTENDRMKLP